MEHSADDDIETMKKEPLLKTAAAKGGARTLPFILANEAFERVANEGLLPNMILYLTREYHMEAAKGANLIYLWFGLTTFMPIVGAFVADSFAGRFPIIGFGSISCLLGTFVLWLTALIPQARPKPCPHFHGPCEPPKPSHLFLLYSSLCFLSVGAGGIRSSSIAFGAEQVNQPQTHNTSSLLQTFFSWYYSVATASVIIATTCIVFIQDNLGWKVGYGVPFLLMILSTLSFFLASPIYVKSKPDSSLLTGFAQVLVASFRKRNVESSSSSTENLTYYHGNGSEIIAPTETLSFLNKACIITNPEEELRDGKACDTWSLCTVEQVEELKRLIKIIPIWSTGVFVSVTVSQGSFAVLQLSTVDRHITNNFEIPAGSFTSFLVLALVIWVFLYDSVIIPLASKIKGKRVGLTLKQKMGIGILFSAASMASIALFEGVRRETAIKEGYEDNPEAVLNISAMWILPFYIFGGLAEAFNAIAQTQFFYAELSKSISSVATSLVALELSAASLVSSLMLNAVDGLSRRGGQESWVSTNINKGHLDYYYWLLAGICVVNFVYYVGCCRVYGPCRSEEEDEDKGENSR